MPSILACVKLCGGLVKSTNSCNGSHEEDEKEAGIGPIFRRTTTLCYLLSESWPSQQIKPFLLEKGFKWIVTLQAKLFSWLLNDTSPCHLCSASPQASKHFIYFPIKRIYWMAVEQLLTSINLPTQQCLIIYHSYPVWPLNLGTLFKPRQVPPPPGYHLWHFQFPFLCDTLPMQRLTIFSLLLYLTFTVWLYYPLRILGNSFLKAENKTPELMSHIIYIKYPHDFHDAN